MTIVVDLDWVSLDGLLTVLLLRSVCGTISIGNTSSRLILCISDRVGVLAFQSLMEKD